MNDFWRRPICPLNVWKLVRAVHTDPNGTVDPAIISLQEIPINRMEEALDFFVNEIVPEDPLFIDIGCLQDPVALQDLRNLMSTRLRQRISIAAYTIDLDGNLLDLVGLQFLRVVMIYQPPLLVNLRSERIQRLVHNTIRSGPAVHIIHQLFNVDRYLCGSCLYVRPAYRGYQLERDILKTIEDTGRFYGINIVGNLFCWNQVDLAIDAGYRYFDVAYIEGLLGYEYAARPATSPTFMYQILF